VPTLVPLALLSAVLSATSLSLNRGQVLGHLVTNTASGENGASGTLHQHQLYRTRSRMVRG